MSNSTIESQVIDLIVPEECQSIYGFVLFIILFVISEALSLSKCKPNGVIELFLHLLKKEEPKEPAINKT